MIQGYWTFKIYKSDAVTISIIEPLRQFSKFFKIGSTQSFPIHPFFNPENIRKPDVFSR